MSLAAKITAAGIQAPSYADILASLQVSFQSIYGTDAYIGPDSQDGQLLAVFAAAIHDANQMAVAVYNAFSPATAQGAGLSSVVKINGLARLVSSDSTAVVTLTGQGGTIILNGIATDILGSQWALPATVTIPLAGTIDVTATCTTKGAITAASGTITKIATPTLGWQSVTNAAAATVGAAVEPDATLRQRQAISTSLPALSVLDALIAAVANIAGVQRYFGYENDSGSTDSNGIPAHSISLVVEGGDIQAIGDTISAKKTPGTRTYGTTSVTTTDPEGISNTINFYELTPVPITVEIDITALSGYVLPTGDALVAAVAALINSLNIGEDVLFTKLYTPANLNGSSLSDTYDVTAIRIARTGSPAAANVVIAFNEAATCIIADITLTVT